MNDKGAGILEGTRKFLLANPIASIFMAAMALSWVLLVSEIVNGRMDALAVMFFDDPLDTFMDYFNSVVYSMDHPYTRDDFLVIYPPLITVIYGAIGHLTGGTLADLGLSAAKNMRNSEVPMMVFVMILFACLVLLQYLITRNTEKRLGSTAPKVLFAFFLLSYPVLWTIERGNSIFYAVLATMVFLQGYRSENRWVRYSAYISLGFAAGVKIIPAVFAFMILRDRRIKEFLICLAVIIVMFLGPFVFTDGNIFILMESVLKYNDVSTGVSGLVNIKDVMAYYGYSSTVGTAVSFLLMGLTILITVFNKSLPEWKIVLLNSCAIMECFSIGVPYLTLYIAIALVMFFGEESKPSILNIPYLLGFIIIFAMFPTGCEDYTQVATIKCMTVLVMFLGLMAESLLEKYLVAVSDRVTGACRGAVG